MPTQQFNSAGSSRLVLGFLLKVLVLLLCLCVGLSASSHFSFDPLVGCLARFFLLILSVFRSFLLGLSVVILDNVDFRSLLSVCLFLLLVFVVSSPRCCC